MSYKSSALNFQREDSGKQKTWNELSNLVEDNYSNFHLERYTVGYTVRNIVLWRRASGAVRDFRLYIRRCTSPNENFEYGYAHSNALLQSRLKLECCTLHKAARHPTKCDVINEV